MTDIYKQIATRLKDAKAEFANLSNNGGCYYHGTTECAEAAYCDDCTQRSAMILRLALAPLVESGDVVLKESK